MLKNAGTFAGRTIFITGATRGIGKEIALKLAKDKANIVVAAKTIEPHPKLPGTIYTAAAEIEAAGGKCLPVQVDVRDEESLSKAIEATVSEFGGLDILVNNASAIHLTDTVNTPMKRYDLMHSINTRGTFLASKLAIPYLRKSDFAQKAILNLSPPLEMKSRWFKGHVAYTMAKYGMSMCVLGMSEEFRADGIAVNALWPRTAIFTAAMEMLGGGSSVSDTCRKADIMADAAYAVLSRGPSFTGKFVIDEAILREEGIKDFDVYACKPGNKLLPDGFLPEEFLKGDDLIPIQDAESGFNTSQFANELNTKSGASGESAVSRVFKGIEGTMTDSMRNEINALLLFTVSGQNWLVDANPSRPFKVARTSEVPADPKPDVTMITDNDTFASLANGQLKATAAFMSGKLKIKGNLAIAMKVEKLFGSIKAKL